MPRIQPVDVDVDVADPEIQSLFQQVKQATGGVVPNFYRNAAVSPAVLESYLGASGALAKGRLSAALREEIALAIAEANACEYCLSAHSYVAETLGLDADERTRARHFHSADAKRTAALTFARAVFEQRGHVSDASFAAVHAAGYGDGDVLEIVAVVAINILTNYLNDVARVDVDFPRVHAGELARAA